METYNGIGVWDYDPDVADKWILKTINPKHDVGENFLIGAAAQPSNCYSGPAAGRTGTIEAKLRNFGEVPPDIPSGTRKLLNPPPAEILAPEDTELALLENSPIPVRRIAPWQFDPAAATRNLTRHFNVHDLVGFGVGEHHLAVGPAGALLEYVRVTQGGALPQLMGLR
ncbi:MAG TPA: hypothetical protein PK467_04790, partial [Candidatus Wallbacteria bacterium]|nr:hypothetical protein [Candidatus Wallbacteria bacterium]